VTVDMIVLSNEAVFSDCWPWLSCQMRLCLVTVDHDCPIKWGCV